MRKVGQGAGIKPQMPQKTGVRPEGREQQCQTRVCLYARRRRPVFKLTVLIGQKDSRKEGLGYSL